MLITERANTLGQTRHYQEEDVNFLGNKYLKMPAITEGLLNLPYLLSCFIHREILDVLIGLKESCLQFLNICKLLIRITYPGISVSNSNNQSLYVSFKNIPFLSDILKASNKLLVLFWTPSGR